jgi:hypothetical protein
VSGWQLEVEPEVDQWLAGLDTRKALRAAFYIDLLAAEGVNLGNPYSSHLGGKLRELRFHLERQAVRITYFMYRDRIVLLTVFTKSRQRERAEVARAQRAMALWLREQGQED